MIKKIDITINKHEYKVELTNDGIIHPRLLECILDFILTLAEQKVIALQKNTEIQIHGSDSNK